MRPIAYIETSVVSYLTDVSPVARCRDDGPSAGDSRVVAYRFHLVASELVVREAAQGDLDAARTRLKTLASVTLLDATEEAEQLAREPIVSRAVPSNAAVDAAHIAIATANRVHYLVTWNFRHIANAAMRSRIERTCRSAGYEPPVICTPDELMEVSHDDQ